MLHLNLILHLHEYGTATPRATLTCTGFRLLDVTTFPTLTNLFSQSGLRFHKDHLFAISSASAGDIVRLGMMALSNDSVR